MNELLALIISWLGYRLLRNLWRLSAKKKNPLFTPPKGQEIVTAIIQSELPSLTTNSEKEHFFQMQEANTNLLSTEQVFEDATTEIVTDIEPIVPPPEITRSEEISLWPDYTNSITTDTTVRWLSDIDNAISRRITSPQFKDLVTFLYLTLCREVELADSLEYWQSRIAHEALAYQSSHLNEQEKIALVVKHRKVIARNILILSLGKVRAHFNGSTWKTPFHIHWNSWALNWSKIESRADQIIASKLGTHAQSHLNIQTQSLEPEYASSSNHDSNTPILLFQNEQVSEFDSLLSITVTHENKPISLDDTDIVGTPEELRQAINTDTFWSQHQNTHSYNTGLEYKNNWNLTENEVLWLNEVRFWSRERGFSHNDFKEINYKLYLRICHELDNFTYDNSFQNSVIKSALNKLDKWSLQIQSHRNYSIDALRHNICHCLFVVVESAVESFYLKTPWSLPRGMPYSNYSFMDWESVGHRACELITELPLLSDEAFAVLFTERDSLWKKYWKQWDMTQTKDKILWLFKVCKRNKYLYNIYLEGANELALIGEKELALNAYATHIVMAKKVKVKPKTMNRESSKLLYIDKTSKLEWTIFFNGLTEKENLNRLREKIHVRLFPLPKKIKLNSHRLKVIEKGHRKTAHRLGEILKEDDSITLPISNPSEIHPDVSISVLDTPHRKLLWLLTQEASGLSFSKIEEIARENKMFANKLIDSINEAFYETTGEPILTIESDTVLVLPEYISLIKNHIDYMQ